MRHLSRIDQLINHLDRALHTLSGNTPVALHPSPADGIAPAELSAEEKRQVIGLMRVNHTGEVCAQALYQGQALTAKLPGVAASMAQAADEEIDHLAWCDARLRQLGARPSLLNPLWYAASFGLGAAAGAISDRISLGFVAATEEKVCAHLKRHLAELPPQDSASRAIVEQMLSDEARHQQTALEAGGKDFPAPVKAAMALVAKAMTATSYRI
jgi:3-demethoxyubiquinol 3-hydroxylase